MQTAQTQQAAICVIVKVVTMVMERHASMSMNAETQRSTHATATLIASTRQVLMFANVKSVLLATGHNASTSQNVKEKITVVIAMPIASTLEAATRVSVLVGIQEMAHTARTSMSVGMVQSARRIQFVKMPQEVSAAFAMLALMDQIVQVGRDKIIILINFDPIPYYGQTVRNGTDFRWFGGLIYKGAQWPIGYGVGLRIKRSSVRIRPCPLR